ncbi:unnamed protein product [Ceutorhynchus assimilis]|uniref:Uncharacterized protein n=1 Tax=Ceutorhynchus assimilis TaxID=467358 RepID=A0A9N9MDR1_9CUCU|nr:unnamed protein product [Ceutorhynchus assimilis]
MVSFDITGKVALITGGASGLGYKYALELLRKGAKGVTLADVNAEVGQKAIEEIESEFGKGKAVFVVTDVTSSEQFEEAFKQTVANFQNVDILVNNAGILNDGIWQKEVDINVNGVINGILLGLENYIPKHKSGDEGVILNISSIAGIVPFACLPVYTGTKFAVHGMTLAWGLPAHYERTKVRVIAVGPGVTQTPLITDMKNKNLSSEYEKIREVEVSQAVPQTTDQIAPHVMRIIEKAPPGTLWIVEGGEKPYQYVMPDRHMLENKIYLD